MLEIRKDIPMPKTEEWPWKDMEPGDSVVIKDKETKAKALASIKKIKNFKFVSETNSAGHLTIWLKSVSSEVNLTIQEKITQLLLHNKRLGFGVVCSRFRNKSLNEISGALDEMEKNGEILCKEFTHKYNKKRTRIYTLA